MPHTLLPELQSELESTKKTFEGLGISAQILEVLGRLKFTHPTPIQLATIPVGIEGKDVLGIAQTGTGKTLAFGIPMVQRLMKNENEMGLVLVPTRELALQVYETIMRIAGAQKIPCALLMGGESMHRQLQQIRAKARIIIATPGRLNDHLQQRTLKLDRVSIFVLDEADRMLDMGFAPQIKEVAKHVPAVHQTLLFSATMPHELTAIAHSFMKDPQRIEMAPQGTTIDLVTQEVFYVQKQQKLPLLLALLNKYRGSVLVFSRTKHGAKNITRALINNHIKAGEIHSNKTLKQRIAALEGFKKGTHRVLVATDIAARGIHVNGIEVVINFDLPQQSSDYVHRIGRTGRAGETGHAISFATSDQRRDIKNIERLMKKAIKSSLVPELPKMEVIPSMDRGYGDSRKPFNSSYKGGESGRRKNFEFKPRRDFTGTGNSDTKVYIQTAHKPSTESNRPFNNSATFTKAPAPRKSYDRPAFKKSYGDKPAFGEKRSFGDRPAFKKSYGDKPAFGEKRSFGERPAFKKSYGDKPAFGERKSYGDKPAFRKSFGDKPAFGEKRSFGDKPAYKKSFGDKPAFRKAYGDKPVFGEKRAFGDKPAFGEKTFKRFGSHTTKKSTGTFSRNRGKFGAGKPHGSRSSFVK